jgi:hypothetical protein
MIKLGRIRAEQKSRDKHFSDSFVIRMNENHKKICEHYQKKVKELEEKNHLLEISKGEMYDEIMSLNQSMHSWKEWSEDALSLISEFECYLDVLEVSSSFGSSDFGKEKIWKLKERINKFMKNAENN